MTRYKYCSCQFCTPRRLFAARCGIAAVVYSIFCIGLGIMSGRVLAYLF